MVGEVISSAVGGSSVSSTKNASPLWPSFMTKSTGCSLTVILTMRSLGLRKTLKRPNRTWKGDDNKLPSGCSTTMMSIAPERVAAFISGKESYAPLMRPNPDIINPAIAGALLSLSTARQISYTAMQKYKIIHPGSVSSSSSESIGEVNNFLIIISLAQVHYSPSHNHPGPHQLRISAVARILIDGSKLRRAGQVFFITLGSCAALAWARRLTYFP
jgi:hypothetical protein